MTVRENHMTSLPKHVNSKPHHVTSEARDMSAAVNYYHVTPEPFLEYSSCLTHESSKQDDSYGDDDDSAELGEGVHHLQSAYNKSLSITTV